MGIICLFSTHSIIKIMSLTVVSTGIYLLFVQPVIKQGFQMKNFCFYFL